MFLSQDTHVDYEYLGVCVPVHIVHDIHVVGSVNRSIFQDTFFLTMKFLKPQELKFLLDSLQMIDLDPHNLYTNHLIGRFKHKPTLLTCIGTREKAFWKMSRSINK